MDITSALTQLNLSDREAKLYTSLLELGQATPLALANTTGLKRPTVYLDLEALRRKRLVGLAVKGKKTVYVAESPEKILGNIREQESIAQQVIPMLKALENRGAEKPKIRLYDRRDEILKLYHTEVLQSSEVRFISNVTKIDREFPGILKSVDDQMQREIIKEVREITSQNPDDIAYAKKAHVRNHQVRIIPQGHSLDVDISLWENNVGMYSLSKHYWLVISDPSIVQAFRAMFEFTWKLSRKPNEVT